MTIKVLYASTSDMTRTQLPVALKQAGYQLVPATLKASHFIELLKQHQPDMLIIQTLRPDRLLRNLLANIRDTYPIPVLVLVLAEICHPHEVAPLIQSGASTLMTGEVPQHNLENSIELTRAHFLKYQQLQGKLLEAERRLAERRDIDRAKGILMSNRGISENEAYSMLRSLAMQKNMRLGELAKSLVTAANLLQ